MEAYTLKADTEAEINASLPEYMPDIMALVRVDCNTDVTDVKVDAGRITVEGDALFTVLYQSGYGVKLNSAEFTKHFSQTFTPKQGAFDTACRASSCVTFVSCRLNDARTPLLKAKIQTQAEVRSCVLQKCVDTESSGSTFYKRSSFTVPMPRQNIRSMHECNGEIVIPRGDSAVGDIIMHSAVLQSYAVSATDGSISCRGNVLVKAVYESEDGSSYHSVSKSIPFGFDEPTAAATASSQTDARVRVTGHSLTAVMDNYGENRLIKATFDICTDVYCFDEREYTVATDLFTPNFSSETATAAVTYPLCPITSEKNFSFDTRTERYEIPYTELYDASCRINSATVDIADGGVNVRGSMTISVLGKRDEGFDSADIGENFEEFFPIEVTGDSAPTVNINVTEVIPSLLSDGSIAVKVLAEAVISMYPTETRSFIAEVVKEETLPAEEEGVTAAYYFPSGDDTLWSVAKHYGVNPSSVLASGHGAFDEDGNIRPDTKYIFINK